MEMKCFGCGCLKDTESLEYNTQNDDLVKDVPIEPLFVLCAESRIEGVGWKHVVVCHACFAALELDMWISSDCWKSINPVVNFRDLPEHTEDSCGKDNPEEYAHIK